MFQTGHLGYYPYIDHSLFGYIYFDPLSFPVILAGGEGGSGGYIFGDRPP